MWVGWGRFWGWTGGSLGLAVFKLTLVQRHLQGSQGGILAQVRKVHRACRRKLDAQAWEILNLPVDPKLLQSEATTSDHEELRQKQGGGR